MPSSSAASHKGGANFESIQKTRAQKMITASNVNILPVKFFIFIDS